MNVAFLGTSCAEPTSENGFTSFLLDTGNCLVLIDASGNPIQSILKANRDPMSLNLVVITHYHADHIAGYPSLIQTLSCMGRKRKLEVICSQSTQKKVQALHNVLELNPPNTAYPIRIRNDFTGDGLRIKLLQGDHSVPTSMVMVRSKHSSLLYTSDTAFNSNIAKSAQGCQALIHEATFSHSKLGEPNQEGHSSAYQAGLSAAAAGVGKLFLCHICWHKYTSRKEISEEATAAFQGEIIVPELFTWYSV